MLVFINKIRKEIYTQQEIQRTYTEQDKHLYTSV